MDNIVDTFILGIPIQIPYTVGQILIAAVIGLCVGIERAFRGKVASLRTFSMICAGSCLFTILSVDAATRDGVPTHDIARIAAQVVAGVGFLGGGVIFKTVDKVEGITTAAMIWLTAAIGMACGFDHLKLAIWTFLIWGFFNYSAIFLHRFIDKIYKAERAKKIKAASSS